MAGHQHRLEEECINEIWMFIKLDEIYLDVCVWLSVWCCSLNTMWAKGLSDGRAASVCVSVCLCVCVSACVRENVHMCCLVFFSPLWCLKCFFLSLVFKPCCFGTPWAFKPLGGRYGLVFEFPAAHRDAHKQLAQTQCTVSPSLTQRSYTRHNSYLVTGSTEHVWRCSVLFLIWRKETE